MKLELLSLVGNTDPVYALLRCAATIRKNSALESEGVRSKQSITTSLDNNNKSRSSSPCQGKTSDSVTVLK